MIELIEVYFEVIDSLPGALDGACEEKNNLDNFFVLGYHFIETGLVLAIFVLLLPIVEILGASEDSSGGLVNGFLNLIKRGVQNDSVLVELDVHFEKGLESSQVLGLGDTCNLSFSTYSILHSVERVLGGVQ